MSSYIGRHAQLYDLFYGEKPYESEAAFVHACLQSHGPSKPKRLLELACGTGSHAFWLERYGYEITASDYSVDMLDRAREKGAGTHSKVQFQLNDMRSLPPVNEPYDAVLCLFDSLGYVATNEALNQVFQGIHRTLRQDGLLVFEFWHAAAMLRSFEPSRIRRWKVDGDEILRISETKLDVLRQLATVSYTVFELHENGTYSTFTESQVNRYFLVQEMANFLSLNHFTPLRWYSGFSDECAIDENTWHILAVAKAE